MRKYCADEKIRICEDYLSGKYSAIVKSEMYYLNIFTDEDSLRNAIVNYMTFYSTQRIQERFNGKAPPEVRAEAMATDTPAQYPIPENRRIQKYKARYAA